MIEILIRRRDIKIRKLEQLKMGYRNIGKFLCGYGTYIDSNTLKKDSDHLNNLAIEMQRLEIDIEFVNEIIEEIYRKNNN